MIQLSDWNCPCGACDTTVVAPHGDLYRSVAMLDSMVDGLVLTSGIRCPVHNEDVGGTPNSKHLTGEAVDLDLPRDLYHLRRVLQHNAPLRDLLVSQGRSHLHLEWSPGRGRESFHKSALRKVGAYYALAIR